MHFKKWWFANILAITGCFLSCKTKTDTAEMVQLILSSNQVQIGDSIYPKLSNGAAISSIIITPNAGTFRNGYYITPSTLNEPLLNINLKVTSNSESYTTNCTIIRGNKLDSTISFSKTILPILTSNCNFSGCHGNGSRAGRVELSQYDSVFKTVNPYQPEQSILYISLIKTDPLRRMPPAGPLNNNRIQLIRNWIEQGGLNN